MRPVRTVTAEEENFRIEPSPVLRGFHNVKRDPIEPEPVGTIIITAFHITGYDQDCDGSLMARLAAIDKDGGTTGWRPTRIGLYSDTSIVVTQEEWESMFDAEK